jgi:cell division protein FtsI/penicillin-binding protein 2
MKSPRRIILALGTALILGAGLIFILMEREKAQVQQLQHSEAANAELIKLVELYSQRTTLFLSWVNQIKSKANKEKITFQQIEAQELEETLKASLTTKEDLDRFELIQNKVSSALGDLLTNPSALQLKPTGLEKIEESINRSRMKYHQEAIAAKAVQEKFWIKGLELPLFESETIRAHQY